MYGGLRYYILKHLNIYDVTYSSCRNIAFNLSQSVQNLQTYFHMIFA